MQKAFYASLAFILASNEIATYPFLPIKIEISLYIFAILSLAYETYVFRYFHTKEFSLIKDKIKEHTDDCNQLNHHIEELDNTQLNINSYDYGDGLLKDTSSYNFKRSEWSKNIRNTKIHNCSASVCKSASDQPFKYLCKYFDIDISERTLSRLELALNNYLAANQGRKLLELERDRILTSISDYVPPIIYLLNKKKLTEKLGFEPINLKEIPFQTYKFQYVSAGGNSSYEFAITLDTVNLEKFIKHLGEEVRFKKSAEGQRALMTPNLRDRIKKRDNYTCQICGLSIRDEKNLLIEIDHIIPISKGGITSEENLQALCWRCNRSKGARAL